MSYDSKQQENLALEVVFHAEDFVNAIISFLSVVTVILFLPAYTRVLSAICQQAWQFNATTLTTARTISVQDFMPLGWVAIANLSVLLLMITVVHLCVSGLQFAPQIIFPKFNRLFNKHYLSQAFGKRGLFVMCKTLFAYCLILLLLLFLLSQVYLNDIQVYMSQLDAFADLNKLTLITLLALAGISLFIGVLTLIFELTQLRRQQRQLAYNRQHYEKRIQKSPVIQAVQRAQAMRLRKARRQR
jgi:flagellar biosynthesis protein FlhB